LGLKNEQVTHLQNDPRPEEFQAPADQLAKELHQKVPTVNNTQTAENLKARAAVGMDQAALNIKQKTNRVAENLGLKNQQVTHLQNDPRPEDFQQPADQLAKELHQKVPTVNTTQTAENLKAQAAVGVDQAALSMKQTKNRAAENLSENAEWVKSKASEKLETVKNQAAENFEVVKEKAAENSEAAKEGLVANLTYAKDVLVANAEWAWKNVVGTVEEKKEEATVGFNGARNQILDKIADTAEHAKVPVDSNQQN
jgi:hypothetical protein